MWMRVCICSINVRDFIIILNVLSVGENQAQVDVPQLTVNKKHPM